MAEDSKLRVSRASTSYPSGAAAARATNSDPLVELARLIGQDQIANASRDGGQGGSSANPQVPASERLEAATRELSRTLGLRASQREFGSAPAAAPRGEAARQTSPRQTSPRNEPPTVRDEPVEPGHVRYEDEDFNDAPRTVAPRADAPVRAEAIRSEPVRVETPHPRTTPVAHSAYAVEAHEHDPRYAAVSAHDAYEPAYTDTAYAEGHPQADASYDYADEGPLPQERKRKGVMAVAAVLGLVLVGTAGAYAYRAIANATSGPPPVIKADAAPAKIVPEQQKGEASQPRVSFDRNDKNQ
ncbi:MAG: hypothetical protein J0H62_12570, partial [Rhizobiales bacterium]|nr:hypothetical protein [Hyphomicrobiales bacterium]